MSSYVTNAAADTYFDTRYNSALWDSVSESDKTKLLATSTRLMEALNYAGDKADEDQELEFPRGDDTVVPQTIKDACCEIAYALLDGRDVEYEKELIGQTGGAASGFRLSVDPDNVDVARRHNIPSNVAWNMLRPFLRDGSAITLVRMD